MDPKILYEQLSDFQYDEYPYEKGSLHEGMSLISQVINGYWKPRFLLDDNEKTAVEFMNENEILCTITTDDIDFDSLEGLDGVERARHLNFHFPSIIFKFKDNVACVEWQLNPNGFYYMDDDGYGMSDDVAVNIYGFISRNGKALAKFRKVTNYSEEIGLMRQEAIDKLSNGR